MVDVALRSLLHDRGKLVASIAGVAFAAALLLVQIGLFVAFLDTSSALVRRIGGDVWVMGRGTEVVDNGELLAGDTREEVAAHPCAARVRGAVVAVTTTRKPSGAIDYLQVVGVEADQLAVVPWALVRGHPRDLEAPDHVAIDEHEIAKLQLPADPLGHSLPVGGRTARIAGLTRGIRSFALYPYVFTSLPNATRLAGGAEGQATYWVVELKAQACGAELVRDLDARPGLDAYRTADFARRTESYWVFGSGAGGALLFCAVFSLLVGSVIVAQTLYAITKEHEKELATLKAMGATPGELCAFVSAQAGLLAVTGAAIGAALAFSLQSVLSSEGIAVSLSPLVLAIGAGAVVAMCALASIPSLRRVLRLEAAEVFR